MSNFRALIKSSALMVSPANKLGVLAWVSVRATVRVFEKLLAFGGVKDTRGVPSGIVGRSPCDAAVGIAGAISPNRFLCKGETGLDFLPMTPPAMLAHTALGAGNSQTRAARKAAETYVRTVQSIVHKIRMTTSYQDVQNTP